MTTAGKLRELVDRYWAHGLVTVIVTSAGGSHALRGPLPVAPAVYLVLLAAGVWCWRSLDAARRGVETGWMAQHLTWDAYVRPARVPPEPDALYVAMAERMRQTEQHVGDFAARHRLQRLSLALTGHRLGDLHEAGAVRYRDRAHLWLGARWFHPADTRHLAALLEHELAHVRRSDTRRQTAVGTLAVAVSVAAAAWLPPSAAALVIGAVCGGLTAISWWSELACDTSAIRVCGADAVAAMWTLDIDEARTRSRLARTRDVLLAMRTHPPLRLRRWWARCRSARPSSAGHADTTVHHEHLLTGLPAREPHVARVRTARSGTRKARELS